jgi:hypothetical protein
MVMSSTLRGTTASLEALLECEYQSRTLYRIVNCPLWIPALLLYPFRCSLTLVLLHVLLTGSQPNSHKAQASRYSLRTLVNELISFPLRLAPLPRFCTETCLGDIPCNQCPHRNRIALSFPNQLYYARFQATEPIPPGTRCIRGSDSP